MDILYCGSMIPEEIEYQVRAVSAAGNRFQNNMIRKLKEAGNEVSELSYAAVPFPEEEKQALEDAGVVLKNGNIVNSVLRYRKRLKKEISDKNIAICYNIVYPWLNLPLLAKKKGVKSVVVLADFSEEESYRSLLRKIYVKLQRRCMRRFDVVVGLSENIKFQLRPKQRFIKMEGGIEREIFDYFSYKPMDCLKPVEVLYSGLLSRVTGVDLLLEAFAAAESEKLRLTITGKGDLEGLVREYAKKDGRIQYCGHLTYQEYLMRLQKADVLINPRNMNLPENKNNFPSKIMDYLASGKIILSTRFPGWESFKKNITFIDADICHMTEALDGLEAKVQLYNEEDYIRNRKKAREFLWENQLSGILKACGEKSEEN